MFIADVGGAIEAAQDLMLREEARSAVRREEESLSAALEITEVKSLDDLPPGWHGHELVWEWDEKAVTAMTAIKWFNGRSERERIKSLEEEVERLKEQLNNLGSGSIKSFG
jgi:hypothetical protein